MDYLRPVEALIPGARGQVLAALTRDTSVRTLRQVALAAEVSWSQTAQVIDDLAELGIVEHRRTPGGTLVRLVPGNVGAELLRSITDLRSPAVVALRRAAADISPPPLTLTLFGSFARGEARRDSDVDVVAVRRSPRNTGSGDGSGFGDGSGDGSGSASASDYGDGSDADELGDRWANSLGRWAERATAITGNPVNLISLDDGELSTGRTPPAWLREAARQGVTLAGRPLGELLGADRTGKRQRG